MEKRNLLDEKLIKAFKRFKKQEIPNNIVALLPNITWEKIKEGIKHYRLKSSSKTIGKLVSLLLKKEKFEDFRHIVNRICLLDVALHKSKIWIPCSLVDPITRVRVQTKEDMERVILQGIRIEKMNADVYADIIDGFVYVMVIFKRLTRKKGVALTGPLYFSVSIEDPYFFIVKKQIPDKTLSIIVKALGYENFNKHSLLTGRDILSLMQILKNKASGMKLPDNLPFVPQEHSGTRSNFYFENEERLKHAKHYLGEETVVLEELTITGPKKFSGEHNDFIGKELQTTMKIHTKDVGYFMKHMIWKGVVKPPLPVYIKKLNFIGKNKIKLKSDP